MTELREKNDKDIVDVDPKREIKLPGDTVSQPKQERLPGKDERLPGKINNDE